MASPAPFDSPAGGSAEPKIGESPGEEGEGEAESSDEQGEEERGPGGAGPAPVKFNRDVVAVSGGNLPRFKKGHLCQDWIVEPKMIGETEFVTLDKHDTRLKAGWQTCLDETKKKPSWKHFPIWFHSGFSLICLPPC